MPTFQSNILSLKYKNNPSNTSNKQKQKPKIKYTIPVLKKTITEYASYDMVKLVFETNIHAKYAINDVKVINKKNQKLQNLVWVANLIVTTNITAVNATKEVRSQLLNTPL